MNKKMVSGNEAAAYAALAAGVKTITGYPGTPSSEVIASLMKRGADSFPGTIVEWSTNEKVATEIAGAVSWSGKRSMCTMKMSGLNVAYDSLAGITYSGAVGGMVVYVCDDPGVTTGMVEQDVRGFALMSDMAVLEPANVQETYDFVKYAFVLSEAIGYPVFVRSVTNVAQSHSVIAIEDAVPPSAAPAVFHKDITRYTKAGAKICMDQHQGVLAGLAKAQALLAAKGLNKLHLTSTPGGIGVITAGVTNGYLEEGLAIAAANGCKAQVSSLRVSTSVPYPQAEIRALLQHCATVVVIEENETYLEREAFVQGYQIQAKAKIIGKLDHTLSRVGALNSVDVAKAICVALGKELSQELLDFGKEAKEKTIARPITTCAGCPHRGTFMGINKAIKNLKYKKEDIIVTGDIGCTILGMSPPFHTVSTEISMGASIPCAQGFVYAGIDKPVLATMGDSTFFLGGFPGLINAVQHHINLTFVLMDNSWTAMTGMQINPSTPQEHQLPGCKAIDLEKVIAGIGLSPVVVDPFDLEATTQAIMQGIQQEGVSVIIARRECAMPSNRRRLKYSKISVDTEKCNGCKVCVATTGCSAILLTETGIAIDEKQCNGCGLCATTCTKKAIVQEPIGPITKEVL